MGVHGLWEIVAPAARPVNLDNMCDQRLAIDASIWIYHFLKAMRDNEGRVLHHAHVIGFFRRICKLIFFGIRPVFVFDGGAPVLKRTTLQNRKERRKNRELTAKETAQKILTLQLHKKAESFLKNSKQQKKIKEDGSDDEEDVVYLDEVGKDVHTRHNTKTGQLVNPAISAAANMTEDEIRIKKASDPYFLPEMDTEDIMKKIKPNDPRIMTQEELDEFANELQSQNHSGLYDEALQDFESPAFKQLPIATQYQLLSTARLRSRLRMGLTADQLEKEFPDRLEFSKFQIERVRQRNFFTQSLMNLAANENEDDDVKTVRRRVAGARGREYVLQKRHNGWALSLDNENCEKPIVIDDETELRDSDIISKEFQLRSLGADQQNQGVAEDDDDDDDDIEWEDVVPDTKKNDAPINGEINQKFLESLPESFNSFETNLQRAQLYERLKGKASNNSKQPFLVEDDDEQEKEKEKEDNKVSNVAKKPDQVSNEKPAENKLDANSLSFGKSLFAKQNPHGNSSKNSSASVPKASSKKVKKNISDSNSSAKQKTSKKEDFKNDDGDTSIGNDTSKDDLTTPQSTTTIPPWFQHDSGSNNLGENGLASETNFAGDTEFRTSYKHEPNRSFRSRLSSDLEKSIEMELNKSSDDDDEGEMEGSVVPYSYILEQRRRKNNNNGISHFNENSMVVIDGDSIEEEKNDDSVEILNISNKNSSEANNTQKSSTTKSNILPNEIPKFGNQETIADSSKNESVEPVNSHRNATSTSFRPLSHLDSTKYNTTVSESQKSEVSQNLSNSQKPSENNNSDKPVTNYQVDNEKQSSEGLYKPANKDMTEYELALALQEEEYDQQENEEFYESLAKEVEETKRFAESFKPRQIKTSASTYTRSSLSYSNSYHATNFESSGLSNILNIPIPSAYEAELLELRRAAKKELRDADQVTPEMISEVQSLLQLFGIPYITAPMEAESQCSTLLQLGLVDGIVTDDSDTFLFGGTRVFKNMFSQKNSKYVECYDAEDIENEVGLKREEMVELAYLLGSDYTTGVTGVGPVTAMEILANFGTTGPDLNVLNNQKVLGRLKNFKAWWLSVQSKNSVESSIKPRDPNFEKKFSKNVTKIFLPNKFPDPQVRYAYINPEVDADKTAFEWGVPNLDALRKFLLQLTGWSFEKTDELLVPVIQKLNNRSTEKTKKSKGLTDFFLTDPSYPRQNSDTAESKEKGYGKNKGKSGKGKKSESGKSSAPTSAKSTAFEKSKKITTLKGKSTRMKKAIDLMRSSTSTGKRDNANIPEAQELSSSDEAMSDDDVEELDVKPSTEQGRFSLEDYESSSDDDNELPFSSSTKASKAAKNNCNGSSKENKDFDEDTSISSMMQEIRAAKFAAAASADSQSKSQKKASKKRLRKKIKEEPASDNEMELTENNTEPKTKKQKK